MKINKKIQIFFVIALWLICGTSFAYTSKQKSNGGYIGFQAGYGNIHYVKEDVIRDYHALYTSGVDSSGLAGRLYFGYDFNKYFALESGMTLLPKVTYHDVPFYTDYGYEFGDFSFHQNMLDLLGKATLPLQHNVDLYGKAGIADVIRCNYEISSREGNIQGDDSYSDVVPVAGVGVDYGFNERVFADVTYMYYFGKKNNFKPADFIGVGVVYRF